MPRPLPPIWSYLLITLLVPLGGCEDDAGPACEELGSVVRPYEDGTCPTRETGACGDYFAFPAITEGELADAAQTPCAKALAAVVCLQDGWPLIETPYCFVDEQFGRLYRVDRKPHRIEDAGFRPAESQTCFENVPACP